MPEDAHVYYTLLKALDIDEGGMLIQNRSVGEMTDPPQERIVIPNNEQLRREVFSWSHEHISTGHFGRNTT